MGTILEFCNITTQILLENCLLLASDFEFPWYFFSNLLEAGMR